MATWISLAPMRAAAPSFVLMATWRWRPPPATQAAQGLVVSPNPVQSVLRVTGLSAQSPICLFDAAGRLVYTRPYPGESAVLTLPAELARGFYILRSGTHSQRLLLE
ncbi:T9SS type A sorting domain-containing protein [Hymenobacter mellowenesis]|uniref:T9SS type A sorting domain-containing protein n=1 Tax=Hymenobacter mellowenesis TaxID=3063995 RepID=UPI00351041C3